MLSFSGKRIFFDEREDGFKNLPQFLTTMPRGRPRKKNKLTNAERCRRSLKKRKKEDPDLYKTKSAAYRKKHYDKNKDSTQFRLKSQKNLLLTYYKKEQKRKPLLKVISATKDVNASWGIELDVNSLQQYRIIKPSISQVCNIPQLTQPHNILWMMTTDEKCSGRIEDSFYKFQDMLKENKITMVLTEAKPDKIPYAPITLPLKKDKNEQWNVEIKWDKGLKKVLIKALGEKNEWHKDLKKYAHKEQPYICIVGLSVQGNWWFATNEREEDFKEIRTMFSNFSFIGVYGYPLLDDGIDSADYPKWSDVNEIADNNIEDSKIDHKFVGLEGTDASNIPEDLQKLVKPCYCYYTKPLEQDDLEPRGEYYEIVKVVKNKGCECQVRFRFHEYKNKYEQDVDVKDIQLVGKMGRDEKRKSRRVRKDFKRYSPEEEDINQQEYKATLKSIKQDNEKLKRNIEKAREICEIQFSQRTEFGSLMSTIKHCTISEHTSSTESGAWKNVNAEELLIELLRSTIPLAYVDITYDFFLNIIPKGVFENQITKGKDIGSSYSHCAEVGSERITVVSLGVLINCL